jgi:hypothetical protein
MVCHLEGSKKIYFTGGILKEFFVGGNAKYAYFAEGKCLFTLKKQ